MRAKPTRPAGVYVHLPFARGDGARDRQPKASYLDALRAELDKRFDLSTGRRLHSIYFGGGDPSVVPPSWIETIVADIIDRGEFSDLEVTLEAHPLDIDRRRMAPWRSAGTTRLIADLGSLEAGTLERLGRTYGPSEAARALQRCHAFGAFEVGVDLAFAVPGQTVPQFRGDLERLSELGVPDSVFGGEFVAPEATGRDERPAAEMLERLVDWAGRHCLRRYEVASFCRPGRESRHNRLYWDGGEFIGLGAGAASFVIDDGVPRRRRNVDDIDAYVSGAEPQVDRAFDADEYLDERVRLALRHRAGLDWKIVVEQFDGAVSAATLEAAQRALDWAVDRGFGEWNGDRYRPTDRGLDVADGLARQLSCRIRD